MVMNFFRHKNQWLKACFFVMLVEFAYNNSYHSSIGMAPFEALYKRKYWTPRCGDEVGEKQIIQSKIGPAYLQDQHKRFGPFEKSLE